MSPVERESPVAGRTSSEFWTDLQIYPSSKHQSEGSEVMILHFKIKLFAESHCLPRVHTGQLLGLNTRAYRLLNQQVNKLLNIFSAISRIIIFCIIVL